MLIVWRGMHLSLMGGTHEKEAFVVHGLHLGGRVCTREQQYDWYLGAPLEYGSWLGVVCVWLKRMECDGKGSPRMP